MRFDGIEYFFEWRGVTSSFVIFGPQHGVERYYLDMPRPVRLRRKANTSTADGPLQISKETLFYDNDGSFTPLNSKTIQRGCAKYNLEYSVVLHATIEEILLRQLFLGIKREL